MKISELRIGNYILGEVEDWKVGRVVAINVMGDDDVSLDIDAVSYLTKDLEPIPLTEDWLLKFGFENYFESEFRLNLNNEKYGWNGGRIEYDLETKLSSTYSGLGSGDDYGFISKIEYVHQLQNLYFALTGEELVCAE